MQLVKSEKFEESVDISIKLGVDPNKSDQVVRGAVTLPNSLGKKVTVAVFADGDQAEAAKAGQVRFRTDKNSIIHGSIGKISFDEEKLKSNASALIEELKRLKPASAKGTYIGNIAISSTMGPGVKINSSELL
jgi:large subunit ribosomal protein L1